MCEGNMGHYDDAMNGYEFIALYYPDPNIRLVASWNYSEIQALINSGGGGSEREVYSGNIKLTDEEILTLKEIKETNRFDELVSNDRLWLK